MKILWHNHKCIIWASYLEMTNHHFRRKYAGRFRSVLKAVRLATFPVASRGHFAPQLRSFRVELCSDGKIWRPVAVILAFSKSPTEWLESIWDCIWDEENWMQAFTFRDNQRCWKRKLHYPHSYMGSHVLPKRIHSPNFCQDPNSGYRRFQHPPDPTNHRGCLANTHPTTRKNSRSFKFKPYFCH